MSNLFSALKVSQRITAIPAIFVLCIAGTLLYSTSTLANQASDALVVDLAGRQRMLNQRLSKELLTSMHGGMADHEVTLDLLRGSLTALRHGGPAPLGDGTSTELPSPSSQEVRDSLDAEAQTLIELERIVSDLMGWDQARRELRQLGEQATLAASTEAGSPVGSDPARQLNELDEKIDAGIQRMEQVSIRFHEQANAATGLIAANSQWKVEQMSRHEQLISACGILLGSMLSFFIGRGLVRSLEDSIDSMDKLRSGDLTHRVKGDPSGQMGAILHSVNSLAENLQNDMLGVRQTSRELSQGVEVIMGASQLLAESASKQATSIEEVSAALEDVAGAANRNANFADRATGSSGQAEIAAQSCTTEMQKMNGAMNQIKESSSHVSNIIKVIDGIAFQTNLLALNAAVEAARAGESGKGFAVVAEEVRSLAQRSAESARSTSALIEEANRRADAGVAIATRVGEFLSEIVDRTRQVTSVVGEISTATLDQSSSLEEIFQTMSLLSENTQINAVNAEKVASIAIQTSAHVSSLAGLVQKFNVDSMPRVLPEPASRSRHIKANPRAPFQAAFAQERLQPSSSAPRAAAPILAAPDGWLELDASDSESDWLD